MDKELLKKIESIRKRNTDRMRADGGDGSGNWGHIGRPGKKGGSQKGGGQAFRITKHRKRRKQNVSEFTSQAQIRDDTKRQLKEAQEAGNDKLAAKIEKRMSKMNMNIKSADIKKEGKAGYQVVNNIDLNASRNILADKKGRGKSARENSLMKATGTREVIEYTFPHRTTRGGDKSRGGKTTRKRAKN